MHKVEIVVAKLVKAAWFASLRPQQRALCTTSDHRSLASHLSTNSSRTKYISATETFVPRCYTDWVTFESTSQVNVRTISRFLSTINMSENKFLADYAKVATSGCKKCKQKLAKGSFRIAKLVSNPFSEEGGDMKQYHHPSCVFETFIRARASTKIIEDPSDVQGFDDLEDDDKQLLRNLIKETLAKKGPAKKTPVKGKTATPAGATPSPAKAAASSSKAPPSGGSHQSGGPALPSLPSPSNPSNPALAEKDNSFRQFRRLCADIAEEPSYTGKTAIVAKYIKKGSSGDSFYGDVYLLLKLLLPGVVKTVYNLNSKQLAKIFSRIFGASETDMVEDLEQGDVAETVRTFFEQSQIVPPLKKSSLSIQDVDKYLTELAKYTKEDDQQTVLVTIAKRCTANDLKMVIRLIKHDLRINAGAKHVLDALDSNAYQAFQASRNLRDVVDRVQELRRDPTKLGLGKKLSVRASLMTPILPMLAEPCKSVEFAFKKCPNGMYAEIKYDGERVQVHKQGDDFNYFSRSLKPVLPHKVNHFKEYIPQAFKHGNNLILDAEVLLIDNNTGKPLPFGTLGVHKKAAFKDANVCLFIFDCIQYNGENLLNKPIKERRRILHHNMKEIPNRILFSEMKHINEPADLKDMMLKVFREGLEGLVLKDINGIYEPGKRHWLKVKKDYLAEGAMADSADLVVLGAYFGTGNKGGIMSIFLMGVYDPSDRKWCTVTKCGSGFDDKTLETLQKEFDMVKVSKDYTQVPSWLNISRNLVPDFVVKNPKDSQVWEITGAEFTKSESHTADGISIRFPRCTKMRDDKTWKEATSLPELKDLYDKSKQFADLPDMISSPSAKKGRFQKKNSSTSEANGANGDHQSNGSGSKTATATATSSLTSTPQKRKVEQTESSPLIKKKRSSEDKPVCKSYQTSPAHKETYTHPSPQTTNGPSNLLPDVFRGMRFFIPEEVHDIEKLKRYIIAFDGDIVKDYQKEKATHIVVWNGEMPAFSTKHVTAEWVWTCIKKRKIVPVTQGQPSGTI